MPRDPSEGPEGDFERGSQEEFAHVHTVGLSNAVL